MTEFACADVQAVLPKAVPACVGLVWVEQESWTLTRLAWCRLWPKQGLRAGDSTSEQRDRTYCDAIVS